MTSAYYSKTCVKQPLSKRPKIGFQDQLWLNGGQKYCRMLQGEHPAIGSILQYFRHSLSYRLSLISLFCLFLSGRFTQVLLSVYCTYLNALLISSITKANCSIMNSEPPDQTAPKVHDKSMGSYCLQYRLPRRDQMTILNQGCCFQVLYVLSISEGSEFVSSFFQF